MNKLTKFIYRIFSSKKLFYVIIGLLVLNATWFALTVQYPMAFDENYHFGIIKIYSHQWLPFITSMPANSGTFGDLTRYDSYMFHYLMSFPYRLIAIFVQQEVAQIIILRFINIGIFVGGLFLYRRLFKRVHIPEGLINFSLLMLILIPVVPFLAATINYDNLFFLLVPLLVDLTITCSSAITKSKKIPATSFILFLIVGCLASLVKYAFLPIFLAVILYLLIIFIRAPHKTKLLKTMFKSFTSLRRYMQIVLVIGIIISSGLFIERYGVNIVQYHSFEPDCAQVQPVSHCLQWGPWGRNYWMADNVANNDPDPYPVMNDFVSTWFDGMMEHLYFAINYNYDNFPPLQIPISLATEIGLFGLLLCVVFWQSILRVDRRLMLFGLVVVIYIGAVFYANFAMYLKYRTALALNGRYLVMVFPLLFVLIGLAYHRLLAVIFKSWAKYMTVLLTVVVIFLALQGGGMLTHLMRAQDSWYWQNQIVINFNKNLKNIVSPLIINNR
ncbi:MAG: hypothetical protein WCH58_02655 [Candidatus Saccharibacteria bacterium]